MRLLPKKLLLTLALLLSCSGPSLPVPPPPPPTCDPGSPPEFPTVTPEVCGDRVCLPPADVTSIWEYERARRRHDTRVNLCLDTRGLFFGMSADPRVWMPEAVKKLSDPRLTFLVVVEPCGHPNAYYDPMTSRIRICSELLPLINTATARFFLAHEIAHAYIVQLGIPFTGSHEAAADELAAYLMHRAGWGKDLLDAAAYWGNLPEDDEVPDWDDHPRNGQRYHRLRCWYVDIAKTGPSPLCNTGDFSRVQRNWKILLEKK